jgi:dihydrofolate reductase
MILSIIVAISKNYCIGNDNELLWHLPKDLKFFKLHTSGKPVIMGRKTFESIGKPLPNRRNMVISSQVDYASDGIEVFNNLNEAIEACNGDEEVFIIGGGNIYKQSLSRIDKLYVTFVDAELNGDVFFPRIDFTEWREVFSEFHTKDEKHMYDFAFKIFEKNGMP